MLSTKLYDQRINALRTTRQFCLGVLQDREAADAVGAGIADILWYVSQQGLTVSIDGIWHLEAPRYEDDGYVYDNSYLETYNHPAYQERGNQ